MTGQPRNDYDDEDDYYPFSSGSGSLAQVVFDIPRPPPQFTGILDSSGAPIFRVVPPKPPIGFSNDPNVNHLFAFNPDTDFFYTSDMGEVEDTDNEGT